jgi:hypothetical protein
MPSTLVWDKWPLDMSWLNDGDRPAGRHGKLRARGEQLVFEDGTVARFWGTNVAARALFQGTREAIANQAKRIAALGYNLVRIHHHDSDWVDPNVFEKGPTTQRLDAAALETLDWWVKCLKDEGVYLWIDVNVGRRFRPGDDIAGFEELGRLGGDGRGFNYVNPRIEALMQQFSDRYLGRVNGFTGLALKDDPAVAAVLVTNENDLTTHFGSRMLPNANNPFHQGLFEESARRFSQSAGLPWPRCLRLWEPGPGKIVSNELEAQFFRRTIDHLRVLGVTVPVATTSYWGDEDLVALPSLTLGDIIDVHSYGEAEALSVNPRVEANFISWIGAAQVAGKPLSISEWNVEYPKRDRFTAPLYVAAIADLQGWDAPMIFDYMEKGIGPPKKVDTWSTGIDPAITALMPAAAVMFRQRHVRQATTTYRFEPTREALYDRPLSPRTSATLRTLVEQSRLLVKLPDIPELAWDEARGPELDPAIVVTEVDRDFIPPGEGKVRSDTAELERDWVAGVQTIDTPMSQAAAGWIGNRSISLRDVEIRIETPKATVAFTSLDGRPIASSTSILLTVVGQVVAGPGDKLPLLAEPVRGSFSLRSARPAMSMTALSPTANPKPPGFGPAAHRAPSSLVSGGLARVSPLRHEGDHFVFQLPRGIATHWFLIQPTGTASGGSNGVLRGR